MNCINIAPCDELKDFVSHFWFVQWDEQVVDDRSTYFATANSLTEIAFAFKGSKQSPELYFSSVQGQTSHYGQYPAGGFFELFGVSLYSYAIPYLFHMPALELNNTFTGLETLFGREAQSITERIVTTHSPQYRIKILSDSFKAKLASSRTGDALVIDAVKYIKQSRGNLNIERLSQEYCYSQKQFKRRFKENTGFNPKIFARIVRFESILNNYNHYPNLTAAAHAHGYYDQAHFIRDFRSFSGFSPKDYFEITGC